MSPVQILLVDDDLEGIQGAHDRLLDEGFSVQASHTATTALNLMRESRPALVITAAVLPDTEPLGLVRSLREQEDHLDTPIVVAARDGSAELAQAALDTGADAYLEKPLRVDELLACVHGLLAGKTERDRGRRERALLHSLDEVISLLARHEAWEAVLPDVAGEVARAIPFATTLLLVRTPMGERAMIAAVATANEQSAPQREIDLGRYAELAESLRHCRPVQRDQLPYDLPREALGRESKRAAGGRQNLATFPIRRGRRGQGLLVLLLPYPARDLSPEHRAFAARVAEASSLCIADVRRSLARGRVDAARMSWLDSDVGMSSWADRDETGEQHKLLVNLVEHSADAIVAADMNGVVRVFNHSAERLFGHPSEGVIGRFNVEHLTLPGKAREHMRILRSAELGEPGFVHNLQTEIVSSDGEIVPVSLSAAILLEGEVEVATVGIFHDLRHRLALETRLEQMSVQLVESEKLAALAALAGTTAHELNQPLTAIMGLVEMLLARAEEPAAGQLERVYQETERMNAIVQRIGRITRFSTKSYVGETEILDLDRSSETK